MEKIRIGISSCLLGENVRYDGAHKYHSYIERTLGGYFDFRSFCPEVASGLGIPRPAVHLKSTAEGIRCVGVKDGSLDVTDAVTTTACAQDHWIRDLCGYILKKDSPSCGMERVKVYTHVTPVREGTGLFAKALMNRFPYLPVEEEGRLGDPVLRENFIQRVFILHRWQKLNEQGLTTHGLMVFHSQHKLIAMSHNQSLAKDLGRLVADVKSDNLREVADEYLVNLMQCLKIPATRGNHVNVLQHIQGYLKTKLDSDEKKELVETIDQYRSGILPLIVPLTLLRHHFRKQPDPFIDGSYYMCPHPGELALLNQI